MRLSYRTCAHKFIVSKAIVNLATNGNTTDSDQWGRGEGIYAGKKARTMLVEKCVHCGKSYPFILPQAQK